MKWLLVLSLMAGCTPHTKGEPRNTRLPINPLSVSGDVYIDFDFEDATITQPGQSKRQQKLDMLQTRLPSGQPVDVGIFYESGKPSDRFARIITDPENSANHVLQYCIVNPSVEGEREGKYKGRIQMALSDMNFTEAFERFRMYLHPDLKLYRSYPDRIGWFTINELWAGPKWKGHPNSFRISLRIVKEEGVGKPLILFASGTAWEEGGWGKRGKWKEVWSSFNKEFELSFGEWLDMEVGYKQGDQDTGRFYVGAKRKSDRSMKTVSDVHDWTYNSNAKHPVPLTNGNPLKSYISGELIDYIRNNGKTVQLYYDDLEILKKWPTAQHHPRTLD